MVRAWLAIVCMIFIVHTIAAAQPALKMCLPAAYAKAAVALLKKHLFNSSQSDEA
jgi:hypothetical protein